jgi:acyl carrier protein
VLAESLYVDEGDLTSTATLQGDLGAESLDFLEIVFRLEREFGIDIPDGELFPRSVFQGNPDFVREGQVTDQGMSELRSRLPYADLMAFDQDRRLSAITDLFTVGLVARYIAWKLDRGVAAGANHKGGVPVTHNASPDGMSSLVPLHTLTDRAHNTSSPDGVRPPGKSSPFTASCCDCR